MWKTYISQWRLDSCRNKDKSFTETKILTQLSSIARARALYCKMTVAARTILAFRTLLSISLCLSIRKLWLLTDSVYYYYCP